MPQIRVLYWSNVRPKFSLAQTHHFLCIKDMFCLNFLDMFVIHARITQQKKFDHYNCSELVTYLDMALGYY